MQSISSSSSESTSIEDLFTLGLFDDAYRKGEAEILALLVASSLPRALLAPRLPSGNALGASTSSNSILGNSGGSAANQPGRTPQSAPGTSTSTLAKSASSTHARPESTSNALSGPNSLPSSSAYDLSTSLPGKLASSSSPAVPVKPKELCYDNLSPSDQHKLKALIQAKVPTLAIMIQCLFELNLKDQILPLVAPLCGTRYEEYPFELSFLVVNYLVTVKEYPQAQKAAEAVLSNLRSQLGPVPLIVPLDKPDSSTGDAKDSDDAPTSPSKSSSSSSADSLPASLSHDSDDELMVMEEAEAIQVLRQHFGTFLELYIFHILCPQRNFADAKSKLFAESRLHPKLLKQWIFVVDQAEAEYLEELRRQEEDRRSAQLSADLAGLNLRSEVPKPRGNTPKNNPSIWSNWIGDDDDEMEITSTAGGPSGRTVAKRVPLHRKLFRMVIKTLGMLYSRYASLSPLTKKALAGFLAVALAALVLALASTKWYKKLPLLSWLQSPKAVPVRPQLVTSPLTRSMAPPGYPSATRALLGSQPSPFR